MTIEPTEVTQTTSPARVDTEGQAASQHSTDEDTNEDIAQLEAIPHDLSTPPPPLDTLVFGA